MPERAIRAVDTTTPVTRNPMLPIRAHNLGLVIDQAVLLHDVNLELNLDTRTVVMGANGAGKSVLLRLLHGLLVPTSGDISFGGRALNREQRQRQALVFQRPVLLRRSAIANVEYVLKLHKRDVSRASALLDQVGLLEHAARPARQLSGGEQQRLALARALALEPRVLFLDEPSANLDPTATAAIERIINQFHAHGTKVIMVTHDQGQARRIADDVVFLHRGVVIEHTEATQFFDCPQAPQAQDYLAGRLVL